MPKYFETKGHVCLHVMVNTLLQPGLKALKGRHNIAQGMEVKLMSFGEIFVFLQKS